MILTRFGMPGKRPFTVIVEGNIGAGKTTFLSKFREDSRIRVEAEPVDKWRNMQNFNLLDLMYQDPGKWGFTFQSYVQLTMLQQHNISCKKPILMLERSIYSARYCFVEHLSQTGRMIPEQVSVIDEWFKWVSHLNMAPVDLVVYLRGTPEVAYERLVRRGRNEERSITLNRLRELHELHENWILKKCTDIPITCPVVVLDADLDITELDSHYERVHNRIPQIATMASI